MTPRYPVFIVSKGRSAPNLALTARTLSRMGVPFRVIVEPAEVDEYARTLGAARIVPLDMGYKDRYDTCDDLGETRGKGPGAARNYAWDLAAAEGAARHWVMDDNINGFFRLYRNIKTPVADGTILRVMEDFADRYENVPMAGPNYFMFASRKSRMPPLVLNTRIYSCNLIETAAPYRWRGRYNEDTDLSLRMLKDGLVTVQFNAFLQGKVTTQKMAGGNTAEFYAQEGTRAKSQMQVALHPDVSRLVERYGRPHHYVDYSPFRGNKLVLRRGVVIPEGIDDYGMVLEHLVDGRWVRPGSPAAAWSDL